MPIETDTGAITLLDFFRPFAAIFTASDCRSYFVPHAAINYQSSEANQAPVYSETPPFGRLIGQEMYNLMGQLKSWASTIDPADVKRFLGCLEVSMSRQLATQSARAQARDSLKLAIMKFIEDRLGLPNLSVALILQNFGAPRATLHRKFDADDGVRNNIRRREPAKTRPDPLRGSTVGVFVR